MKILLADDHDLIRETLVLYLGAQIDAQVVEVGDVAGAERAIAQAGTFPSIWRCWITTCRGWTGWRDWP